MKKHTEILILGGGISGCTSARFLQRPWQILEKESLPGGLSTQYQSGGFWFDFGGHYFHFMQSPEIRDLLTGIVPFNRYRRRSKIWLFQRLIPFPLQSHLENLPPRYRDQIRSELALSRDSGGDSLRDSLRSTFGPTLYEIFFHPFMTKYYRRNLRDMSRGMEKGSIPPPSTQNRRKSGQDNQQGYNPEFFYPTGGLRRFWESYAKPQLQGIRLRETVVRVDLQGRLVETDRHTYSFKWLINTIPLPQFLSMLSGFPLASEMPGCLRHSSTRVTNMVLARRRRRFHWVYLPEATTPYYRMGYYPNAGVCKAYLEETIVPTRSRLSTESDAAEILAGLGVIREKSEILYFSQRTIPISYVQFDKAWFQNVPATLERLRRKKVFSIGRYGSWNYTSMAVDALAARNCAEFINLERS